MSFSEIMASSFMLSYTQFTYSFTDKIKNFVKMCIIVKMLNTLFQEINEAQN